MASAAEEGSSYTTREGWHTVDDGEKLYTKTWTPTGDIKAKVVFVHGYSDHCNTYGTLFPDLSSRGIQVFGFDQRGWGRTVKQPSEKGLSGPTPRVLSDITSFLTSAAAASPSAPLFLMGHSMGGAEILNWAAQSPPPAVAAQVRGYLAESPFVALTAASQPWRVTILGGRLAAKVLPHAQKVSRLDVSLLSRDQEEGRRMREDPLCHDTGTFEGLAGMFDRAEALEKLEARLGDGVQSMWVGHGSADGICDIEPVRKWVKEGGCGNVKDVTWRVYDGWYHRLHSEQGDDKHLFSKEVGDWILQRSS